MFPDRTTAGRRLGEALADRGVLADLVLAIPRGRLPVARPVADRLGVSLGVVVASKVGAPDSPEYALGAVTEDGTVWYNDEAIERLGVDDGYLESERERERTVAEEKAASYRDGPRPSFAGERVVVVDDGVATGATMRASLQLVREDDPRRLVVAVPVGPPGTLAELGMLADGVVALERPARFRAVGAHYREFDQVTDAEAMAHLDE